MLVLRGWLQKLAGDVWPHEAAPVVAGVVEGGLAVRGKPQAAKGHRDRARRFRATCFVKGRKPSSPMEGVSVRGKASAFTGSAPEASLVGRAWRAKVHRQLSMTETSEVRWQRCDVGRTSSRCRSGHRAEAGLGRVNGPAHLGASRGHPTDERVLVFDMWVAEVGRTHLWRSVHAMGLHGSHHERMSI